MPKTTSFTTFTPLPGGITRPSVMDMLHDHIAMIDLNPLVKERSSCKTPNSAPAEERDSKWYIIKDKVSYLPGGLATGSLSYNACFRSLADGVQTHIYAPLGLDVEAKWTLGGHLPGEPKPPPLEEGLEPPKSGLYIREDVKIKCNTLLIGFVKRIFKESHARFLETLVERAHILESNFANERLKALRNVDPGERMGHGDIFIAPPPGYIVPKVPSPGFYHNRSHSDPVLSPGFSQSSTLGEQSDDSRSPRPFLERAKTFAVDAKSPLSPQQLSPFLLPPTTFDGGFSRRHKRPMTLYPGSFLSEQAISQLPISPPSLPVKKEELPSPPPKDSPKRASPKHGSSKSVSTPRSTPRSSATPKSSTPRSSSAQKSSTPRSVPTPKSATPRSVSTPRSAVPKGLSTPKSATPRSVPTPRTGTPKSATIKNITIMPVEQTIAFKFPFSPKSPFNPKSPFDKRFTSESRMSSRKNLLDDIDDAIDEVFMFTLDAKKLSMILPATTYEPLPATTYVPIQLLPSTTYNPNAEKPKSERKDSGDMQVLLPSTTYTKPSLPPVPAKDEKYRKIAA